MEEKRRWSTRLPISTIYKIRCHAANRSLTLEEFAEIALETYLRNYDATIEKYKNPNSTRATTSL